MTKMLALRQTRFLLLVLRRPLQRPGPLARLLTLSMRESLRELLRTQKQVPVLRFLSRVVNLFVMILSFFFGGVNVVNMPFFGTFWHLPSTHTHGHAQPPNHGCLAWLDKAMAHEKMLIQHGHMPNITDEQQKQMQELQLALREQRIQELTHRSSIQSNML